MIDLLVRLQLINRLANRAEILRLEDQIPPDALENIIPIRLGQWLKRNKVQHKEVKKIVQAKQTFISKSYMLYMFIKDIKFHSKQDIDYICDRITDHIVKPYEDYIDKYEMMLIGKY